MPSPTALKRESPLENETYLPSSHWLTLTLVILRSCLVFRVCLDLVSLLWPVSKQCFTLRCPINHYVSTHFRENQLALGSSGISPLTNLEPPKLHPGLTDRSPSFKFVSSDKRGRGYAQRNILVTIVYEFNILHGLETS